MSSPWRRTKCAALGVAAAVAATAMLGSPSSAAPNAPVQAAPAFNNGTGSAIAEALRVNPINGGLSFGIGTAQALASHQNTFAVGESRGVALGVIGVTLAGEGCDGGDPTLAREDQPQPLRAESGQEGADQGFRGTDSISGNEIPSVALDKFARATTTPMAEAETTGAPFGIPGVLEIAGVRSHSVSGIVDGNTREAIATTFISEISFAGGLLRLGDIRSQAVHRSGAVDDVSGSFSMGSITLAGRAITAEQLDAALRQVNTVLALRGLGIDFSLPEFREGQTANGTVASMSPISIGIRSASGTPLGDVFRLLIPELAPFQRDLYTALKEQDCGNATYTTILDIILGSISPGGSLTIEMGNVSATTSEINRFQFPVAPPPAISPPVPGLTPSPGGVSTPTAVTPRPATAQVTTPASPAATPSQRPTSALPDAEPAALVGSRGGWMAAVSGAGLGLLLLCAEGDRRKMRRAQRMIPLES